MSTIVTQPTADHTTGQRWAYPLLIALLAASMGVSGAPAPLYGLYEQRWHLAPITTTLVFAAYAAAALLAVLMAGQASDKYGRKPLLLGAAVGMIAGLVVFMTADGVAALFVARILHGASVGTAVVVGSAALLDLRPARGARTGHLTGIMINAGIAVTILAASLLAQFAPHPYVAPYAAVAVVILAMLLGLVAMVEPHAGRTGRASGPLRLTRPHVPASIAADFRFAVLGVMAAWSVLGVYLSLFPTFAGQSTGVHSLVFGGAVVAAMAGSAALSQALRRPAAPPSGPRSSATSALPRRSASACSRSTAGTPAWSVRPRSSWACRSGSPSAARCATSAASSPPASAAR